MSLYYLYKISLGFNKVDTVPFYKFYPWTVVSTMLPQNVINSLNEKFSEKEITRSSKKFK